MIAADGVSALSELTAESFDLIITDNEMPQMDGVELCRRVRLDERHRLTLIILCSSALARLDTEALKHDIKAIRFLEKPLKLEFLVELFRTLAAHSN